MKLPSQREAQILTLLINGEKYGRQIRNEYIERTGSNMPIGSLYTTLNRMINRGFLESRMGESCPERGGNRKKYFKITAMGCTALNAFDMMRLQWEGGIQNV